MVGREAGIVNVLVMVVALPEASVVVSVEVVKLVDTALSLVVRVTEAGMVKVFVIVVA